VVDDDPTTPRLVGERLPPRVRLLYAPTGEEALVMMGSSPTDVLAVKLMLPDASGLELAALFRAQNPDLPVIILSDEAAAGEIAAAVREGAVYRHVRTPATPFDLEMTVGGALELARMRRERDQTYTRLERRIGALSIMHEIATFGGELTTHAEFVGALTRTLGRVVDFDLAASFVITDEGRGVLELHATAAVAEPLLHGVRDHAVELLSTLTGRELTGAEIDIDLTGVPTGNPCPGRFESTTHIPVSWGGRVVGLVYLCAYAPHAFSADDERLLYVLANQAADTAQKLEQRVRGERRKMALMVESMADGVVMADATGEVCLCNPAARRLLGVETGVEVTSKYLKDRLGFYPFDLVRGQTGETSSGPHLVREDLRIGDKFLHSIVSPVGGASAPVGVVVVLRDITERKELEQRKEDFVSIVSHELRTPLTSITGALDILMGSYNKGLGDKARRYVQMAREGCTRLSETVDDLLDVAKLERGKVPLKLRPMTFDGLVQETAAKFRPAAEVKRITLAVQVEQPGMRVLGDGDRLTQVLNNLLSNALKFTPDRGRIEVDVFGGASSSSHVGLTLWNNGDPIPEDAYERIFDKFETAQPSPNRRVGGTGLGLAISRGIVEGHGGRIWVEPTDSGAEFVLTLPTAPPDDVPSTVPPSDGGRLALIVSDRPRTALLLKGMLLASGVRVHIAQAADDGLMFARDRRPDVLVLDLALSSGVGPALIEIFKHDPETKNVPLFAVGPPEAADAARMRDADAVLALPLDGEAFIAASEKLAHRSKNQAKRRVLVVDDDPAIRMICREVLERAEYELVDAADGQEALDAIARAMPDLVVLDVMMPQLDGYEVLRRLKAEQATSALPVILLTARSQTADKVRAFKIGAEDYLIKPFDHTELVMRVDKALERREREASASPTTRLPGSAAIEAEIERRLAAGGGFAFCYVDLDNLKSFNDYYGYAKADGVIRQTGDILREVIARDGGAGDFVGHIAGDDFVLITTPDRVDRVCKNLIETFDRLIPLYYNRVDRDRGYIETTDRYGTMRKFPMMSVSVAALTSKREIRDSAQLARLAAEEKRRAKAIPGSAYVCDGTTIWPVEKALSNLTPLPPTAAPPTAPKRDIPLG
jgi:PAS domain S-box-containing protein